MDANCTKWSYATPTTGRMPESGKEVTMDTAALQLLGVTPELGAEVTVSYSITDKDQTAFTVTDTFTLVGYWDYDELMPVHYINISRDYADDIEAQAVKTGLQPFRTDLNVMLASGTNIQGQMEQVDTDLGYTWDSYTDPNSVRIGVNWGYTSSQLESQLDPELVIAIAAFLLLVIFTGYLIIYNIFQISVAGDIRFYGLLKTIGTTPRQLKRIIRQQALLLCLIGIPAGLLLGYGIGAVLVPVVLRSTQLDAGITTISTSPVIFVGSVLFALLTLRLFQQRRRTRSDAAGSGSGSVTSRPAPRIMPLASASASACVSMASPRPALMTMASVLSFAMRSLANRAVSMSGGELATLLKLANSSASNRAMLA
jgi:putative ABC transport system permease protein